MSVERVAMTIDDGFARPLADAGLDRFDTLMYGEVGRRLHGDEHSEVRYVEHRDADGSVAWAGYLKRSLHLQRRHLFRLVLRGARPHVETMREVRTLSLLRKQGFNVANVMAWGERTVLGLPVCGFMLSERVEGTRLEAIWSEPDPELHRRVLRSMGHLMGRLHAEGFFQIVRPRDLICTDLPVGPRVDLNMTLLDRASAKPWRQRCTASRCLRQLHYTAHRYRRNGIYMTPKEASRLAVAYCQGLGRRLRLHPAQIVLALTECILANLPPL